MHTRVHGYQIIGISVKSKKNQVHAHLVHEKCSFISRQQQQQFFNGAEITGLLFRKNKGSYFTSHIMSK